MFEVSDAFKDLMKSNVRPKCEPTITVKDAFGSGKDLVWYAKDISNMTYKRGIDPIGRNLPFMELRWTEVYQGKLNSNAYPQIYENVAAFLPVELKFDQSLGFFNTWKILFESGKSWKDIFDAKKTWRQIKNDVSKETITFPILFLSGKPTVKNNVVEWVAYDLMHYLDIYQSLIFKENANTWKIPSVVLKNCCSSHLYHKKIIECIEKTIENQNLESTEELGSKCILDGNSNSILKDFFSVRNKYLDFSEDFIVDKNVFSDFSDTEFEFPVYLQYNYPKITKNPNISSYQFKKFYIQENAEKKYEKSWNNYKAYLGDVFSNQDFYVFEYIFDGYGRGYSDSISDLESELKKAFVFKTLETGTIPTKDEYKISVNPIERNSIDIVVPNYVDGESFSEQNNLCIYGQDEKYPTERKEILTKYFNNKCDSIEMSCAPNISLETGDLIRVETDLYDSFGERIWKEAVIVEFELEYSGYLKQKIKSHEVKN